MTAELRRFPRIPAENTVLVKKIGDRAEEGFAKTKVMGLGGCCFVTDTLFAPEEHVEIFIAVSGKVVVALGRVVWTADRPDGRHDVGVEFQEISDEDRRVVEGLFAPPGSEVSSPACEA